MRGPFRPSLRVVIACLATTAFLAACGSSAAKSNSTSPTTTNTTTAGGSGGGDFCARLRATADKVTNPSIPTNASEWKSLYDDAKKSLDQLRADAPAEIKGDIDTLTNAYDHLVNEIDSANGNLAQIAGSVGSALTSSDVKNAIAHIQQYAETSCKVSLSTTSTT